MIYTRMSRKRIMAVILACVLAGTMSGCSGDNGDTAQNPTEGAESDETQKAPEEAGSGNAYDDYIRKAIASVDQDSPSDPGTDSVESKEQPFEGKSIEVDRSAPNNLYVSSMENPDTDNEADPVIPTRAPSDETTPSLTGEASPSPTDNPSGTPTPTPTPYITPEEFDVDTCCIYINGESDSAYGTELVTAINKARTDLGYKELVNNKGLATCADRRTRELAAYYSHTRPNGKPFYSVAPEHFKAEMLVVGTQKAENAVDTLIKTDPVSRSLIFTRKYQSIGASSFKYNGLECAVVAFGL